MPQCADSTQLVRTKKPTGNATMPWYVKEAKLLDRKINGKVHLKELDDDDNLDGSNKLQDTMEGVEDAMAAEGDGLVEGSEDEVDTASQESSVPKGSAGAHACDSVSGSQLGARGIQSPVAASTQSRPSTSRRSQAHEILNLLSATLNPTAREEREQTKFAHQFVREEVSRLAQENRDLRIRNDVLNDRVLDLTMQLEEQKAEVKRLQTRLEMYELMQTFLGMHGHPFSFTGNPVVAPVFASQPLPAHSSATSTQPSPAPCTPYATSSMSIGSPFSTLPQTPLAPHRIPHTDLLSATSRLDTLASVATDPDAPLE